MNILIDYHRFLVEALLGAIFLNIFIAYSTKVSFEKTVKWNRIGYFIFWAVWSMAIFSGLIVFVFMKQKLNLPIISMIVTAFLLPILDGYRAIKVGRLWREGNIGINLSFKVYF